jgi:hypothetical protein
MVNVKECGSGHKLSETTTPPLLAANDKITKKCRENG